MSELFKILWANLNKKYKTQFFIVNILTIVSSLLEVFSIGMVIPLISVLIEPSKLMEFEVIKNIAYYFSVHKPEDLISPIIGVFIIAATLSAAIRILSIKINADFSFSIGSDLSIKAYRNILYRDYCIHKDINSSEDISKLVSKINAVIQSLIFPSVMLLSALLMFVIIFIVFLFVNFQLTLSIAFGLCVIYALVTFYFKERLKRNSIAIASLQDKHVQVVQESVGGIQDVIINNSFKYFIDLYSDVDINLRKSQSSTIVIAQAPRYLIELISIVFLVGVSYYFAFINKVIPNDMILPTFITIAVALQRILPIGQQAYRSWANIEGNKQSLIDVLSILTPIESLKSNAGRNIKFTSEIKLRNLSFKYKNSETFILDDINLTIKKGQKVGFIGSTGSGKSTLIDIIMGLLKPTGGELKIDDQHLHDGNKESWYEQISHVPQNIYLVDSDFYQNIAFGSAQKDIDKVRVKHSAKIAYADEFISKKANSYSENVGERGAKLSGGQRQRIGIARCIYKNTNLMILDEATSALDSDTETMVMRNINDLNKKHTVLIIAHRSKTLRGCDMIVKMESGKIINIGTYDDLVKVSEPK